MTKDSRLRTVQREYGKVFVVVFGIKYQPPVDGTQLKVGDDVMVVEGSTPEAVTFQRQTDGLIDRHWRAYGYIGGPKAKDKALADWAKFLAGEKSIGMKKEKTTTEDPNKPSPLIDMARDYEATEVAEALVVRFREADKASSFRLAASRHKHKVAATLTDENTGETVVIIHVK